MAANLALKYRPKTFSDVTEQKNVVTILESMCEQQDLPNRNFLLVGPRGCGKAQPLHSKVLTPNGFITMGEVQIGTEVFTHSGKVSKITGIYPQGKRDIYQIVFDDNTCIEVSDHHLNEVCVYNPDTQTSEHQTLETLELKSLFDSDRQTFPYTNTISVECPVVDWKEGPIDLDLSNRSLLSALGHFDLAYLHNSKSNRIKFLKAIFLAGLGQDLVAWQRLAENFIVCADLDSGRVSESLQYLFRSLGCKVNVVRGLRHGIAVDKLIVDCNPDVYNELFSDIDVVKSDTPQRFIKSINYLGRDECQCIMVEAEDHTYISDDFIPTHNTTLGRIVANKLNEGQGTPIEIDAASNSGVDTVRTIINQAHQYPIGQKYKVFIADEVHAFSSTAWQALLLTLEEQPAKSVFILLTTNPEKIPATILSRVQKFQLSNISLSGLEARLKYVIEQENSEGRNITYTDDAIAYIAKLAKGGMRDALTLLDKALVYSSDITSESLRHSLDIPEYDDYFNLLNAYAKRDNVKIMMIVDSVYNSGLNFVKWFEGFQSFVINISKYVFLQDISKTMIPSYYADKLSAYNQKHAQICLSLSQVLVDLIAKISRTEYMEEVAVSYLCQRR